MRKSRTRLLLLNAPPPNEGPILLLNFALLHIGPLAIYGGCGLRGITSNLFYSLSKGWLKLAVVSNKPDDAVQSLCEDYFPGCFDYAAGERSGANRKPAPDMICSALTALGVRSEEAVYIGDSEVDILTARNASLDCGFLLATS